ncbi:MAG: VCBS repeat-containing protein, partial [Nanoarchaeota archaeon]|nr:VCBS repeat-containing protein [Nanoarchaeota archaeon]
NGIIKVFINNGTTFNENLVWEANFSGINAFNGALAFGDVDNDGKLDLALAGAYPTDHNRIYINNGTSFVRDSNWLESLPLVGQGGGGAALIFADFNNDGKLDLAFAGSRSTDFYTGVYINNGTSLVDNSSWKGDFTATFGFPSLAIGDYNNDGFTDLAAIGARAGDHLKFYNNTGSNFSLHLENGGGTLAGYLEGSIAFGDSDNDGDLDFAAMGRESGRNFIYTNNNSIFEGDIFEQQDMHDDNMEWGGLVWFDVDNDANLDLIINGYDPDDGELNFTVYISNASLTKNNSQSTPPNTFSSSYSDGVLNLTWNNGSDPETNSSGLYYNLMVGNSTDNHTIVSGVYGGSSNPTAGYFGNMMQRKNISLNKYLSDDTYYWYVQTIDTGLRKSNWSERQSIVVGGDTAVPTFSSVSSSVTSTTATITWTTNESSNSTVHYGTTTETTSSLSSTSLVTSHSIALSSLSASTIYYYNVSSCDYWANCNTSIQYNFTTSDAPTTPPSGGGSSGSSSSSTTTTTTTTPKAFDVDFGVEDSGSVEAKQGDIKTFSFQGQVTHKITATEVTATSIKLIIESEPIILILNVGETKQIDINNDGLNDFEIKLISILSGKAKFSLTKLDGAYIVAQEEIEEGIRKEVLFDVKVSISNLFKIVKSGRDVIAEIEVLNVNNIGQVDVLVDYYISGRENNTIAEGSDTLAVEAVASFVRSLVVPYDIKAGRYLFNVDVSYKGVVMASGSSEFMVIKSYEIVIGIGVFVLIVVSIFFYLWRIKRKTEKIEKKEAILEKIVKNFKNKGVKKK